MVDFTNLNDVYHIAMIVVGVYGVMLSTVVAVNSIRKMNAKTTVAQSPKTRNIKKHNKRK